MDTAGIRLFDSELKIMEVLWTEGDVPARHIAGVLEDETGWNVNTTYTVIKRCIKKGVVERREPHFVCHALVTREEIQEAETDALVERMYGGSVDKLFAALIGRTKLSPEEIERLKGMIDELS